MDSTGPHNSSKVMEPTHTSTLDSPTHDRFGVLIKSILTIKPPFEPLSEYHINKIRKQSTQKIVRSKDQSNSNFNVCFYRHLQKKTDIEYEKEDVYYRLKMNQIENQSDLESALNKE